MNNMGKNIAIWLIVGLVLMTVFNQFTKRQDSAQQIAAALAAPYVIGEHTVISGASIGLVSSASGLATVDDYLRAADTAMYRAKSQSLGVCVFQ